MWPLTVIRKVRTIRRRLFGRRLPHWLSDAVGLVKYVNFLGMVPTIYAIMFQPRHFFKSLPAILAGKKDYYVTPLRFLSNIAVVQIAVLTFFYPDDASTSKWIATAWNLALVGLSPFLIIFGCASILSIWFISIHIWPINKIFDALPFNYNGALLTSS